MAQAHICILLVMVMLQMILEWLEFALGLIIYGIVAILV